MPRPSAIERWPTTFLVDERRQELPDSVVVEEPWESQLAGPAGEDLARLAVTLRTPGYDDELVAGLLYAEGIVETAADIAALGRPGAVPGAEELSGVVV